MQNSPDYITLMFASKLIFGAVALVAFLAVGEIFGWFAPPNKPRPPGPKGPPRKTPGPWDRK